MYIYKNDRRSTIFRNFFDHIILQQDTPISLTSAEGLMNPSLTLLTDHNPAWVGTPHPVSTFQPSPRITNAPDLSQIDTLTRFASNLDTQTKVLMTGSPPIVALTQEAAGLLHGAVTQASVTVAHSLTPAHSKRATGKGHCFKDG